MILLTGDKMKKGLIIVILSVFSAIHADDNLTDFHDRMDKIRAVLEQLPRDVSSPASKQIKALQSQLLPLQPLQIDVQKNSEADLIIGLEDPYEEVTITGDFFLDGNIYLINHGILNLIDANFTLRGDIIVVDSTQFHVERSDLNILAEYLYQYIIIGLDNSTITFDSTEISVNGLSWNATFSDNSYLSINDTYFYDGITASLGGNAEVDILRSNPFEWVIFENAIMTVSQSGPHIFWFEFPDTSQADFSFPDGEYVTNFTISVDDDNIDGIGYNVSIDSTSDVWWGLILQAGSDVTIRDSFLRTTGIMAMEGDSLAITGIVNDQYYTDFTAPLSDRNFHLINTSLGSWNVYPWGVGKLLLDQTIIGELGSYGNTETQVQYSIVDGSGGYVFTGRTSFTLFYLSSILSHVIANDHSVQLHYFSSSLLGNLIATDASLLVLANTVSQQLPVARDTSVILELAIQSPGNPTVDQLLPIIGTAVVSSGPFIPIDLESYRLDYGIGDDPENWIQIGSIHQEEVRQDVLEIWNTFGLETGQYNLKLTLYLSEEDSLETYQWVYLGESWNDQVIPAGDRILGLHISESENHDYDAAFAYAQAACLQATGQFFKWSDLEPIPGQIGGPVFDLLEMVNYYYPQSDTKIELNIPIINTVQREVPPDLISEPFDSPLFINRFKTLLDSIFMKIPDVQLIALNIGNEHGFYLAEDTTQINAYKTFFDSVKVYAEMLYFNIHEEDLNVGTTLTFDALTDSSIATTMQDLNQSADIVSVNYYAVNPDFTVKEPYEVIADLNDLVNLYSDTTKPIYLTECGYPSSPVCNSSEAKQAEFMENVFKAWDIYYNNIKYISFFQSTDWPLEVVDSLAIYYGLEDDTVFKEFLRTLGLRTYPGNGTNKPAYDEAVLQAQTRGFCDSILTIFDEPIEYFPEAYSLAQNYPNPFNTTTTINYQFLISGHIDLSIYNLFGQKVRTLVNDHQGPGRYSIVWDGKDDFGLEVSSGIYLCRLRSGSFIKMRKLILLE